MWEQWKAAFCSFLFHLQMCGAVVILDCMVTRNGTRMLYHVSNQSHPLDFKGALCDFWWNDGVLPLVVNDNTKTAQVMGHSFSSLEMSQCLTNVSWTLECWSQMTGLTYYSAKCSTPCSSQNFLNSDNLAPNTKDKDGWSSLTIGASIGIVVLLGLVGLIVFLFYKYKDILFKLPSCSLIGRLYSAVKRENDDQEQSNV